MPNDEQIIESMARAIEKADFECQADFVKDVGLIDDWSQHCAQAALAAQRAMGLVLIDAHELYRLLQRSCLWGVNSTGHDDDQAAENYKDAQAMMALIAAAQGGET